MTHPTLSHAVGERQPALLTDTIDANLQRTIARFGDRDAVVDCAAGVRLTYAAFGAEVDRLARALVAAGFRAGERVGIWAPNRVEWVIVQYATARAGLILVNINPAYRTHELEYVLKQAGISLLVTVEAFKTSNYRAMAEQVQGSCPDLRAVVYLGTASWTQLLDRATEVTTAQVQAVADAPKPDDPINIQYTSGTTGFPKGATLSHSNILNNGYFVGEICRYTEADRICIPVPFYHCFGMVMGNLAATSHGACMVIPAPAFDPAATLAAVQQERCTSLYGVPTMFIAQWALLEGEGGASYDLSTVRTGIMAGSPCPIATMREVIERMHMSEVTIAYGMTETPARPQLRAMSVALLDHGLTVPSRADEEAHCSGHRGDDHLLRDDGDVPGVDPDTPRRFLRPQGRDGRAGGAALGDSGRRPRDGGNAAAGNVGRVLHQGLFRDARLLAGAGEDRGRRGRRLDAHR